MTLNVGRTRELLAPVKRRPHCTRAAVSENAATPPATETDRKGHATPTFLVALPRRDQKVPRPLRARRGANVALASVSLFLWLLWGLGVSVHSLHPPSLSYQTLPPPPATPISGLPPPLTPLPSLLSPLPFFSYSPCLFLHPSLHPPHPSPAFHFQSSHPQLSLP